MKVKCGTPIFFSAIHSANFCHTSLPPDQKEPDYFTRILSIDFLMKLIVMNAAVLSYLLTAFIWNKDMNLEKALWYKEHYY